MADKIKYTVNRSMQDGAQSYERGDTREMTEVDAAPLLATGALSKPGAKDTEREPPVRHTFGTAPTEDAGYTSATGETVRPDRKAKPAK